MGSFLGLRCKFKTNLQALEVLVHCMMGKSRSVTVIIAYLCTITGLSWLVVLNGEQKLGFCII